MRGEGEAEKGKTTGRKGKGIKGTKREGVRRGMGKQKRRCMKVGIERA
jgi:hypothetical protein